jgi:hypothetical protein
VLQKNKSRAYFLYALGEIGLIVVGILIAIQVDNWNTWRQDRKVERKYIENLIEDVRLEEAWIEQNWNSRFDQKISGLKLAKDYHFGNFEPLDTLAFFNQVGAGGIASRGRFLQNDITFQELTSTGNFRLIRVDSIKNAILNFYTFKQSMNVYAVNLRTEYATYVNGSYPFNPEDRENLDPRDIQVALDRLRRAEFLALVNQELTYAYSLHGLQNRLRQSALDLLQDLETYLAEF